jgi:hypothetical protein
MLTETVKKAANTILCIVLAAFFHLVFYLDGVLNIGALIVLYFNLVLIDI